MTLLEAVVLVLMLAGACFIGRLFWTGTLGVWFLVSTTRRQRAVLANEIAGLGAEQIRGRLLGSAYFTSDLRRQPPIEELLSRIARHDEIALRAEYTRRQLYSMLSKCEKASGRRGRPEASDYLDELNALLDALAQRARRG